MPVAGSGRVFYLCCVFVSVEEGRHGGKVQRKGEAALEGAQTDGPGKAGPSQRTPVNCSNSAEPLPGTHTAPLFGPSPVMTHHAP